jgi:DNA-binding Lrp family transcriptional regulator
MNAPAKITTWRDVITVHPAADLFPLMTRDELIALGEDIKKNGLRTPVTIWWPDPDSNKVFLLDGRNRLDSMEAVGLPILKEEWRGGGIHQLRFSYRELYGRGGGIAFDGLNCDADPYAYVISANIHRRHLTADQKRDLIAKLLKATPDKSNRQIAKMVGASHPHIGKVRAELESTGDVETVTTSIDTKGRKQPIKKANVAVKAAMSRSAKRPQPPKSQAQKALAQFKVAVDIWFSKMDDDAKREAVEYVIAKGAAFGEVRA